MVYFLYVRDAYRDTTYSRYTRDVRLLYVAGILWDEGNKRKIKKGR